MSSQPAYAPYSPDPAAAASPTYAAAPPAARRGLNLPALFALITGVLLISPVAIVLGHIGFVQARRRRQSGRVLAVVGLVLGYLGLIATVAALVSLVVYVNSGPTPPTIF
jgi:heme/copper-type cytochrome/quinol oxidase subunit 3